MTISHCSAKTSNGTNDDKSKDEGINWVGGSDKSKCFPPKATATADEVRISCRKLLTSALNGNLVFKRIDELGLID
jgi:hypothetical protein